MAGEKIEVSNKPANGEQNSAHCQSCTGCQWRSERRAQWCRMFRAKPATLPCMQHDKFEGERIFTGMMIQKCPMILTMLAANTDLNQEPQTKEQ